MYNHLCVLKPFQSFAVCKGTSLWGYLCTAKLNGKKAWEGDISDSYPWLTTLSELASFPGCRRSIPFWCGSGMVSHMLLIYRHYTQRKAINIITLGRFYTWYKFFSPLLFNTYTIVSNSKHENTGVRRLWHVFIAKSCGGVRTPWIHSSSQCTGF